MSEKETHSELPQEDDLSNIGWAAKSIFSPAASIGSSDIEYNNEKMLEVLEKLMGTTFSISDMTAELKRAGFNQYPAGGDLFWLLKKKG